MPTYRRVMYTDLGPSEIASWHGVLAARADLASPYFRPEFAAAVHAERGDVSVTVIEEAGKPAGFLPFHRGRMGGGRPLALGISDFHAVIAPAGMGWSVPELLRASGLSSFEFDHMLPDQEGFRPFVVGEAPSPLIDLSGGFEGYIAERKSSGSKQVQKVEGLARKMDREVGPVRFVAQESDPRVLETVMRWKSEQCMQTGTVDVFGVPWTRALMHRLLSTRTPEFSGALSALYVGDELAAAHMGMRSRAVWHYWFPSYDEKFAKFSTGLLLLLRLAEAAGAMGTRTIDLGKGDSMYKQRLSNGAVTVMEGRAEVPSTATTLHGWRRATERWANSSALGVPMRLPLKALARWERGRKYT